MIVRSRFGQTVLLVAVKVWKGLAEELGKARAGSEAKPDRCKVNGSKAETFLSAPTSQSKDMNHAISVR